MGRRLISIIKSPTIRVVVAVTLLVSILLVWRPPFTEFLELKLYDLKFRYRGPRPAPTEVAIVAIDDDSLKVVGRWPWSREDTARLLARLKELGPRVIALDIIFAEKQETRGLSSVANLRREMTKKGLASRELMALLAEEEKRADVDRQLAQVIAQPPPTILGFFFRGVGGTAGGLRPGELLGPMVISASTYNMVRFLETETSELPIIGAAGVEVNLPEITQAGAGGGYFNMVPDADGTVRWFPMTILFGSDLFAPMSLVSVAHYLGKPPLALTVSRLGVEEIRIGPRRVPVDRYGRMLINYLGPAGMFPSYSAAAVMEGRLPPRTLQDKIVLIGATAVGIYDLRVTPFSGVCPGVEIQATLIENLLSGNFMQTPRFPLPMMLLLVLVLGSMLGAILPRLSAIWAFLGTLVFAEGYILGNYLLFSRRGVQLEVFYPLTEIALVYLGVTVQSFLAEEKERLRIRKAFESYVAPTVVQEMLKHPELLRLGGERREISILFSDIRGFTTMAENLDPQALVTLLHDFLNPMSEIIITEGGTIDKYMGDAIMALFGAPLEQPDHARLACRAAMKMVQVLADLNRKWAEENRPLLSIGVGVNSGPVAVGNMGSDRLFDYTAVGDNVNLASRLEGLNKYYGTSILVSQTTAEALTNGFILRDVDWVRVKGKAKPAPIYEVLGEGEPDPELSQFLELYHRALALYRERRWPESIEVFKGAVKLRPNDPAAQRYLSWAQTHQEKEPGPEWEPVTVMEGK